MGLITQQVTITLHAQQFKYFISKGYDVPMRKAVGHGKYENGMCYDNKTPITINVSDLPDSSHEKVEIECDYCHKIYSMEYRNYKKEMDEYGTCACIQCTKYHYIEYCQSIYGNGVVNTFQLNSVKEKIKQTMIDKYGVDNPNRSPEIQQRIIETCLKKYNVPYVLQVPVIREKIRNTCLKKYGGNAPTSSNIVKQKVTNSFYKNQSKKSSKQQRYICSLYHGLLNYPIDIYAVDIMLLDDKIACEVDFSGHDLQVQLGVMSAQDFKLKEIVRSETIKRRGYKIMHIISHTDKLPCDSMLLNILELTKMYFNDYPSHTWIEWYLDENMYKNAEYKDGMYFDFGTLQKIVEQSQI